MTIEADPVPKTGLCVLALLPLLLFACSPAGGDKPNILFVVLDTVRADHLSLYGYEKKTTPFLDAWAEGATVFENCSSTANSTILSHGAIFTGLLPTEHGANNLYKHLDDRHVTLAEILREGGYQTYCYSANPHISSDENFTQGFEAEEHPWDPKNKMKAIRTLLKKIDPNDQSNELVESVRAKKMTRWYIKAVGELAQDGLLGWLEHRDKDKPYFAFLNYMEAHHPYIPPRSYRARFLTEEQVKRSYELDFGWDKIWAYTFGLEEYSPEELAILRGVYDACIAELDDLFADLIRGLDEKGFLENTIVVVTSDHGEQLGEHHRLEHQYSLYEPLLHVPLVVRYANGESRGRVSRPVVNFDLFPTLLEAAGLKPPPGLPEHAKSLTRPAGNRLRIAQYPNDFDLALIDTMKRYPDWDPSEFRKGLTAIYREDLKLIESTNDDVELYDWLEDPREEEDLSFTEKEDLSRMRFLLKQVLKGLRPFDYEKAAPIQGMSAEHLDRLRSLGYAADEEK